MKASELRGWMEKDSVVTVEWSDAEEHTDASGMDLDLLPDECPVITVGRIVRVTAKAIFVVTEWFDLKKVPTKNWARHVMQIPLDWVSAVNPINQKKRNNV